MSQIEQNAIFSIISAKTFGYNKNYYYLCGKLTGRSLKSLLIIAAASVRFPVARRGGIFRNMKLSQLQPNAGQIPDVPSNPRQISDAEFAKLKKSVLTFRKMLYARPIVADENGVILGGNMRYNALCRLRDEHAKIGAFEFTDEIPDEWVLFVRDWTAAQKREFVIKDNIERGEWDADTLANEWDDAELIAWDADFADYGQLDEPDDDPLSFDGIDDEDDEDGRITTDQQDEHAEQQINALIPKLAEKILQDYDAIGGVSFVNTITATIDFIKFKYYGKKYPRFNSHAFHPQQFETAGSKGSPREGLQCVADGTIKPERFRFATNDKWQSYFVSYLPMAHVRWAADFPAELSRDLCNEFATGGRVFDPCSGWGGRIVGFLASNAKEYDGNDVSPLQVAGDTLIARTFEPYTTGKHWTFHTDDAAKLIVHRNYYDLVLTSPPYFDVEKDIGGEQSREGRNYEQWREEFYKPLIQNAFASLKHGGTFCLQVGSQIYPLINDGETIGKQTGFEHVETRATDMRNSFCQTDQSVMESIVILRKP